MYYIVDCIKTDEGWFPCLPNDTSFALLAEPFNDHATDRFGLFRCDFSDDHPRPRNVERVSEKLQELLESAEAYAPAMALSREEISKVQVESKSHFSELLIEVVEKYLRAQPNNKYMLAESLRGEVGYRAKGGYYWIVRIVNGNVGWVSRDYVIYTDPLTDFKIDQREIEKRLSSL